MQFKFCKLKDNFKARRISAMLGILVTVYFVFMVATPIVYFLCAAAQVDSSAQMGAGVDHPIMPDILLLSVAYFAFFCLLAFALIRGLYRPILKIERVLNGAVHGKTDFDFAREKDSPALSTIFADLELLIQNMKNLVLRESTAQLMKKQAELDALQSQINPHFLYNTLDVIRGQANARGLHDVERMALSLSQLFRYSISNHDTFVSFEEELTNIEHYLLIQNLRFDNKFERIDKTDPDTLGCKIPKLLIQPLVENAVHHGLEPKLDRGSITISSYRTPSRLIISIRDDGVGLSTKKLTEINDMLRENMPIIDDIPSGGKRRSVGLSNVNARIRLLFGDAYGLVLFSTENTGTEVQLTLPLTDAPESPAGSGDKRFPIPRNT